MSNEALADQSDIEIALEQAQAIEEDELPTAAQCVRACARSAVDNLRLRAYLTAIRDGTADASRVWLKSMAESALRGEPILVGEMGNLRQLGSDRPADQP